MQKKTYFAVLFKLFI